MGFRVWLRRTSNNTLETELMISAWDTMNRSNHLVAILPMRDLANEARKSMSSYARTRVLPVILSANLRSKMLHQGRIEGSGCCFAFGQLPVIPGFIIVHQLLRFHRFLIGCQIHHFHSWLCLDRNSLGQIRVGIADQAECSIIRCSGAISAQAGERHFGDCHEGILTPNKHQT